MKIAIIGIVVALSGCAAQQETVWEKSGASEESFNQDQGQCHAQAFGVPGAGAMQVALVYNSCMRGKGYQLVRRR